MPAAPKRMQVQSVRFGESQWRLVQRQAELEGTSASQFIRDAAVTRAVILWAARNPKVRDALTAAFGEVGESMTAVLIDLEQVYGLEFVNPTQDGSSRSDDNEDPR